MNENKLELKNLVLNNNNFILFSNHITQLNQINSDYLSIYNFIKNSDTTPYNELFFIHRLQIMIQNLKSSFNDLKMINIYLKNFDNDLESLYNLYSIKK